MNKDDFAFVLRTTAERQGEPLLPRAIDDLWEVLECLGPTLQISCINPVALVSAARKVRALKDSAFRARLGLEGIQM